jgi:hypothetical protein
MMRTLTDRDMDALIAQYVSPHPANPGLDELLAHGSRSARLGGCRRQ